MVTARAWIVRLLGGRYATHLPVGRRPRKHIDALPYLAVLDEYVGRWVAVKEGRVVLDAPSSTSLAKSLRQANIRGATAQYVSPPSEGYRVGLG
jgi:hypothetical protein